MKKIFFFIIVNSLLYYIYSKCEDTNVYENVFTHIYNAALWGTNTQGEGFSGGGSLAKNTKEYRDYLEKFMKDHSITSVIDAGCGDWEFSRCINWTGIEYIGYDIVAHVIEKNNKIFGSSTIHFIHGNFLAIDLPEADLFICKHVFQHLDNKSILAFLPQLKKFKYCLITNEVDPKTLSSSNPNTQIGGGQKIDLSKPPFNIIGKKVLNYKIGVTVHQVFLIDNIRAYP